MSREEEVGKISFVFFPLPACFVTKQNAFKASLFVKYTAWQVLSFSNVLNRKNNVIILPPPDKGQIQNKNVPLLVDIMLLEQNTIKFLSPPARMETASVA